MKSVPFSKSVSFPAASDLGDKGSLQKPEPSLRGLAREPETLRRPQGEMEQVQVQLLRHASEGSSAQRQKLGPVTCLFSSMGLRRERHWAHGAALKGLA